jgi:hypothetical protein
MPEIVFHCKFLCQKLLKVVTTLGKLAITHPLNASECSNQRRRSGFREETEALNSPKVAAARKAKG